MKGFFHSLLALVIVVVPLTGCASYSARTISNRAQPVANHPESGRETRSSNSEAIAANNAPLKLPLSEPRIEVWKGERKLLLFSAGRVVRSYHVGLGLSPVGDKVREGDHRTPEGDFYIFTKNPKSAFYLSLGISYPNMAHAKRGLRDGMITKAQYNQIVAANQRKKTPPQNTTLGGTIYIHGNGSSTDWTWGCVALENAEIKELYEAVEVGTPVKINP
jgi:murein L,D-transpeptidase YafK